MMMRLSKSMFPASVEAQLIDQEVDDQNKWV